MVNEPGGVGPTPTDPTPIDPPDSSSTPPPEASGPTLFGLGSTISVAPTAANGAENGAVELEPPLRTSSVLFSANMSQSELEDTIARNINQDWEVFSDLMRAREAVVQGLPPVQDQSSDSAISLGLSVLNAALDDLERLSSSVFNIVANAINFFNENFFGQLGIGDPEKLGEIIEESQEGTVSEGGRFGKPDPVVRGGTREDDERPTSAGEGPSGTAQGSAFMAVSGDAIRGNDVLSEPLARQALGDREEEIGTKAVRGDGDVEVPVPAAVAADKEAGVAAVPAPEEPAVIAEDARGVIPPIVEFEEGELPAPATVDAKEAEATNAPVALGALLVEPAVLALFQAFIARPLRPIADFSGLGVLRRRDEARSTPRADEPVPRADLGRPRPPILAPSNDETRALVAQEGASQLIDLARNEEGARSNARGFIDLSPTLRDLPEADKKKIEEALTAAFQLVFIEAADRLLGFAESLQLEKIDVTVERREVQTVRTEIRFRVEETIDDKTLVRIVDSFQFAMEDNVKLEAFLRKMIDPGYALVKAFSPFNPGEGEGSRYQPQQRSPA